MYLTLKPYNKRTTPNVCKLHDGIEVNINQNLHGHELIIADPKKRRLNSPNARLLHRT